MSLPPPIPLRTVLAIAAAEAGARLEQIAGLMRDATVLRARQVAHWAARNHRGGATAVAIGQTTNRDHSTVLHNAKTTEARRAVGGYEAAIEQAGGPDKVVTVVLAYRAATFKTAIPVGRIDEVLEDTEKVATKARAKRSDPRQEAMAYLLAAVRANKHLTNPTGSAVAASVLWLACTAPEPLGDWAQERAREGGAIISYEVTEGGPGHGNNWRLLIDGLPGDAAHVAEPAHPLPGRPGGPPLNS